MGSLPAEAPDADGIGTIISTGGEVSGLDACPLPPKIYVRPPRWFATTIRDVINNVDSSRRGSHLRPTLHQQRWSTWKFVYHP